MVQMGENIEMVDDEQLKTGEQSESDKGGKTNGKQCLKIEQQAIAVHLVEGYSRRWDEQMTAVES